jgi:hypothetical protein
MSMYGPPAGPYQGQPHDPWGGPDPYASPSADPFTEAPQDPWGGAPVSPGYGYAGAQTPGEIWGPAEAPHRRRSGVLLGTVVVLAILLVASAGAAIYLYTRKSGHDLGQGPGPSVPPSSSTLASAPPSAPPSAAASGQASGPAVDTKSAKEGDCLLNRGTDQKPDLHKVPCAPNTYQVLKRIDGTADKAKCDGTPNLTDWYFYDAADNTSDFVLCLRRR